MPGQVLGRGQQHGHVPIVPAGVHLAGMPAGVGEGVELLHGQRIHVGAQADGTWAVAALDDADHAGLAQAAVHRNAPLGELGGNQVGRAKLFKTQFRVGMDVTAHGRDAGRLGHDGVEDLHGDVVGA